MTPSHVKFAPQLSVYIVKHRTPWALQHFFLSHLWLTGPELLLMASISIWSLFLLRFSLLLKLFNSCGWKPFSFSLPLNIFLPQQKSIVLPGEENAIISFFSLLVFSLLNLLVSGWTSFRSPHCTRLRWHTSQEEESSSSKQWIRVTAIQIWMAPGHRPTLLPQEKTLAHRAATGLDGGTLSCPLMVHRHYQKEGLKQPALANPAIRQVLQSRCQRRFAYRVSSNVRTVRLNPLNAGVMWTRTLKRYMRANDRTDVPGDVERCLAIVLLCNGTSKRCTIIQSIRTTRRDGLSRAWRLTPTGSNEPNNYARNVLICNNR